MTTHYLTPMAISSCVSYYFDKIHNKAVILLVCKNVCKNLSLLLSNSLGGWCVGSKNPIWRLSDTVNGHCVKYGVNTDQLYPTVPKSC